MYFALEFNLAHIDTTILDDVLSISPLEDDADISPDIYGLTPVHKDIRDRDCIIGTFRFLTKISRGAFLDALLNIPELLIGCEAGSYIATHDCNPVEGQHCELSYRYRVTA